MAGAGPYLDVSTIIAVSTPPGHFSVPRATA
jgi:hypothetical protein